MTSSPPAVLRACLAESRAAGYDFAVAWHEAFDEALSSANGDWASWFLVLQEAQSTWESAYTGADEQTQPEVALASIATDPERVVPDPAAD